MKDFDEEFEAILNVAGGYYPPNNPKVLKKYYEKEFESKSQPIFSKTIENQPFPGAVLETRV